MQSFRAVAVTCALLLGFAESPFLHIHAYGGGEDHHVAEQAHVHAHLRAEGANSPAFQPIDPADDEIGVNWVLAVQRTGLWLCLSPERVTLPELPEGMEFLRPAPPARGHGPPLLLELPSRAPPYIPA